MGQLCGKLRCRKEEESSPNKNEYTSGKKKEPVICTKFWDSLANIRDFTSTFGIFMLLFVLAFSAILDFWTTNFTFIDSFYYSVVTLTTVGYGDISPEIEGETTPGLKMAVTVYILLVLGIIANYGLVQASHSIYESTEEMEREAKEENSKKILDELFPSREKKEEEKVEMKEKSLMADICLALGISTPYILFLLFHSILIGAFEKWSVWTIIYFTVVTSTTVGFGDYTPEGEWMRLFSALTLPLCVVAMGRVLSNVFGVYYRRKSMKKHKSNLKSYKLSLKDLQRMDENELGNSDGYVSRAEFLIFMLQATGKVKPDTDIKPLLELFDTLDKTGDGSLSIDDIFQNVNNASSSLSPVTTDHVETSTYSAYNDEDMDRLTEYSC